MIFEYQALNRKGETVSDIIDAASETAAKQKLRAQGLYVVKLSRHDAIAKPTTKGFFSKLYTEAYDYLSLKFSAKLVGIFSRQLATLLQAGMPLLTALSDIIEQIDNKNFKKIIVDVKEKLEEGSSLSNALVLHRNVFSEMYISMVRVGENLGSLDQVIDRLASMEEKKNILKSKIQAALWYPTFMIIFACGVIAFLMIKIVPSLSRMFADMGRELPLPTQIVIGVSSFLSNFWYFLIIAGAAIIYYLKEYVKTPQGREKFDALKLRAPFFSNLYKKLIVLRFTQNLGILLNNRVDILKSFEIVKKIVNNIHIERKIEEAANKIKEGSSVASALGKADFLPKMVLGMIAAGESSDRLDDMLINIGNVYETELDLTISSLTSLIEPVIIVIMGITIGTIVVSVLLPIFEMNLLVQ